ncbi:MAG TPA: DUF3168 domain-containing protein [Clostridia bacterium]
MKDICQAVYKYLSLDADIHSVIGDRLYPVLLPQNAILPSIVYSPMLANYDSALSGDTGFVRQTVQFSCHDKTFKKARELSRLVKYKLQDYKGNMYGLNIQAVFIRSDFMSNSNTAIRFDTDEYMSVIEFEFQFNE